MGLFCIGVFGVPFTAMGVYAPDNRLLSLLVGSIGVLCGAAALVAMARSLRSRQTVFARELGEYEGLMARLATGWARILHSEIVGSRYGSEGVLTHYQLALELELWPRGEAGYRVTPTPITCTLHTDFDVALAGHIVPGTFFGVAYDSASTATMLPQCLITMQGAVLPV
jgi:hypothetical protein